MTDLIKVPVLGPDGAVLGWETQPLVLPGDDVPRDEDEDESTSLPTVADILPAPENVARREAHDVALDAAADLLIPMTDEERAEVTALLDAAMEQVVEGYVYPWRSSQPRPFPPSLRPLDLTQLEGKSYEEVQEHCDFYAVNAPQVHHEWPKEEVEVIEEALSKSMWRAFRQGCVVGAVGVVVCFVGWAAADRAWQEWKT